MGLIWTNKVDGVNTVLAEDVNSLASAIIENETKLEDGASLFVTEVSVTASRTLILTDKDNKLIACNHASVAIVNTIPPNSSVAFPIGSQIAFSRDGVADVSVALGAGVTVTNTAKLKIANQGESMVLLKTGTDTYKLFGSLKA